MCMLLFPKTPEEFIAAIPLLLAVPIVLDFIGFKVGEIIIWGTRVTLPDQVSIRLSVFVIGVLSALGAFCWNEAYSITIYDQQDYPQGISEMSKNEFKARCHVLQEAKAKGQEIRTQRNLSYAVERLLESGASINCNVNRFDKNSMFFVKERYIANEAERNPIPVIGTAYDLSILSTQRYIDRLSVTFNVASFETSGTSGEVELYVNNKASEKKVTASKSVSWSTFANDDHYQAVKWELPLKNNVNDIGLSIGNFNYGLAIRNLQVTSEHESQRFIWFFIDWLFS